MHPKHHLLFQVRILPQSLQRSVSSFIPHASLPQVTAGKHVEHPARLQNSTEPGERQQLPVERQAPHRGPAVGFCLHEHQIKSTK